MVSFDDFQQNYVEEKVQKSFFIKLKKKILTILMNNIPYVLHTLTNKLNFDIDSFRKGGLFNRPKMHF